MGPVQFRVMHRLKSHTETLVLVQADYNFDETLNTLRYANRAKNIKNKPKINEDPKDAMLREFQDEISKLKAQIAAGEPGGGTEVRVTVKKLYMDEAELEAAKQRMRAEIDGDLKKTDEEKAALIKKHEEAHRLKQKELAEQKAIASKLEMLQGKMVVGGENLLDKVAKEEAQNKRLAMKIAEQQRADEMMRKRMSEQQDINLEKQAHYGSLQEEVSDLERKIAAGYKQLREKELENTDARAEFQREKDELCENIKDLSYKFKFQQLVLAHYIPEQVLSKIESTAQYDPVREEWLVVRLNFAGNVLRARYPERFASTAEGAAALEEQRAEERAQQAMMRARGQMQGMDPYMQQQQMALVGQAAMMQDQQQEADKYLSYSDMDYEQEASPDADEGGLKKSKEGTVNSRARATKAKLKAAVAASAMLHSTKQSNGKSSKEGGGGKGSSREEKERRRRKKEKLAKKQQEASGERGGDAPAKHGRPARPATASRRRAGGVSASRSEEADEYPEARGSVEGGLRFA